MVKSCPFDGFPAITYPKVQGGIAATCPKCGAYGPTSAAQDDGQDALAQWNGGAPGNVNIQTPAVATQVQVTPT